MAFQPLRNCDRSPITWEKCRRTEAKSIHMATLTRTRRRSIMAQIFYMHIGFYYCTWQLVDRGCRTREIQLRTTFCFEERQDSDTKHIYTCLLWFRSRVEPGTTSVLPASGHLPNYLLLYLNVYKALSFYLYTSLPFLSLHILSSINTIPQSQNVWKPCTSHCHQGRWL
jgi:hypothetical protein